MCLLIVAEKEFPDVGYLEAGAEQNPHGAGIAYTDGNEVFWHKGLTLPELLSYKDTIEPPFVIHFRAATVGGARAALCHPFPVTADCSTALTGSAPAVLAHNGHWWNWEDLMVDTIDENYKLPQGPWSDTRGIAWLTYVYGEAVLNTLNEKIALFSPDGIKRFAPERWYSENGLYMSYNPGAKSRMVTKTSINVADFWDAYYATLGIS